MKTMTTLKTLNLSSTPAPSSVIRAIRQRRPLLLLCGAVMTVMFSGLAGCGSSSSPVGSRTNGNAVSNSTLTPDNETLSRSVAENQANTIKFEAMIAEAEKHLQRNSDGTLSLNEQTSRSSGMSDETHQFVQAALEHTNAFVKSGDITVDAQFRIHSADASRNVWVDGWHWWGVTVALDNGSTQKLVSLLKGNNLSNAISLIGSVVTHSMIGVIKTLLSVTLGYTIDFVNNNGGRHGVNINVTWNSIMWVTSR